MRIAILGASSQIAKDLIQSFAIFTDHQLTLFGRNIENINEWQINNQFSRSFEVLGYEQLHLRNDFNAIINFVGIGDPAKAKAMGDSILTLTRYYDRLAVDYVEHHPYCQYIFLSSGAVFGSNYDNPVDQNSVLMTASEKFQHQDWYGLAKAEAEKFHRSLDHLNILDVRVFNYFSRTQDMSARFLITDIVRAIRDRSVLNTNGHNLMRDFLHPYDFYQLMSKALEFQEINSAIDCYTKAPIDKFTLLNEMGQRYNLRFEISKAEAGILATGSKINYYSKNYAAKKIRYEPLYSSLDGVSVEIAGYLDGISH